MNIILEEHEIICRLCGIEEESILINSQEIICTSNLLDKISFCINIKIRPEDNLPQYICKKCKQSVDFIYDFRERCKKTENLLMIKYSGKFEQPSLNEQNNTIKNDNLQINDISVIENQNSPETSTKETDNKSIGQIKYQSLLRSCETCGKLIEKFRMRSHINQHLGVQPYECKYKNCKKQFHCPYMLTKHKKIHQNESKHTCEICGKSYKLQKSLYNHKEKHKEPQFNCKVCNKKYVNSTYLKQHMRSHTGERPYKCKICPRGFATSYNLKCHNRSHTKEKPFVCKICGITYGYNSLLKSHIKKNHPNC